MGVRTRNRLILASLLLTAVVAACGGGADVYSNPSPAPVPIFVLPLKATAEATVNTPGPVTARVAVETAPRSPNPTKIPTLVPRPKSTPVIFGAPDSPPEVTPVPMLSPAPATEPPTDDAVPALGDGGQVCQDYLFAGRPAPDVSPGFYVERIVCLTPEGMLERVDHPSDVPGLEAVIEALRMELLATQRLSEARLAELNRIVIASKGEILFHPAVYVDEQNR